MVKKITFALLLIFIITGAVYAQNLTLTTYYPSPQGKYAYMTLVPQDLPPQVDCNENTIGTLFVEKPENILQFCRQDGGSGYAYGPIPGVWTQEDSTIFPSDVQDNNLVVGVGTDQPSARLDVRSANEIDILNLSDSTGEVLTVLDGGYVGIGTDSPTSILHVRDATEFNTPPYINNILLVEGNVPINASNEGYVEMRLRNSANQGSSKIVFGEWSDVWPPGWQGDNFEIRYKSHWQHMKNWIEFWGLSGHRAKQTTNDNSCPDGVSNCCDQPGYGSCSSPGAPIMIMERDYFPNRDQYTGVGIGVSRNTILDAKLVVENWGPEDILHLSDDGTEVLSVIDGGNVGIGVEDPAEKLEVDGKVKVNNSVIYTPRAFYPFDITNPWAAGSEGELAYSDQRNQYYYYNGTTWVEVANASGSGVSKTVAGSVASDGSEISDYGGYSVVQGWSNGVWDITFDTPFNNPPVVTASLFNGGGTIGFAIVKEVYADRCVIITTGSLPSFFNTWKQFTFIAVGN